MDRKTKVKKVFLRGKKKMCESDLNYDTVIDAKEIVENYIRKKYPDLCYALRGGLFFGNICVYPKEFTFNV
jgi:disulfide oxidoreductase YuzD